VSVADLVSKLRAFAADVANLCHSIDSRYLTQKGFTGFSVVVVKGKFYRKIALSANQVRFHLDQSLFLSLSLPEKVIPCHSP
jgi:hypothetical protein